MTVSIRLDAETEGRLNRLSEQTGRTKSYYLRQLIEDGLDDLEDYYLAMEILERVRKGEEPVYSLDEVKAHLGLED